MAEEATSIHKIHSVSSDVRHRGRSISSFPSRKRERLDFDRYLVGRSCQLFKAGIKSPVTLEFYRRNLYYFCYFIGKSTEQLVEYHGPFKKVNGKYRPNVEGVQDLQKHLENYVLSLQERVGRKEIKPSSCVARIPAIKLFCEMNDITLNWRKIGKLLPSTDLVAEDEAYTREQIKKMLQFCDLRTRIIVLFLASSGMRLGGLAGLKHGDLKPIYDKDDQTRVTAVHVRVYNGTEDAHDTFVSPEAWQSYSEYLHVREMYGEKISKMSPVLLSRFARKTLVEGRAKAIDASTIQSLLAAIRAKAGINERSASYNDRYTTKTVHAFRKFFNTTLKSIKNKEGQSLISFVNKERLLGHTLVDEHALEENYDRSDRVKDLLIDYLRALPVLTMSDEARLALQVKKLESNVDSLRTVEKEIAEKDKEIYGLRQKMRALEESQDKKYAHIMSLIQQNPKLAYIKPDELEKLKPTSSSGGIETTDEN
jgi:integrase